MVRRPVDFREYRPVRHKAALQISYPTIARGRVATRRRSVTAWLAPRALPSMAVKAVSFGDYRRKHRHCFQ